MVDAVLIDIFVFFPLVFYALLFVVYFLRARELSSLECKLRIPFSLQLIPFASLCILNVLIDNDSGRMLAGLPMVIYLVYDPRYRLLTLKKPHHHPDRWSVGLLVCLLLLLLGSIGLNWYGYLISQFCGNMLVLAFFIMMGSYSYYQYSYNKRREANSQKQEPTETK